MRYARADDQRLKAQKAFVFLLLMFPSACAGLNYTPGLGDVPHTGSVEDAARASCNLAGITPDRKGYGACMSLFSDAEQRRRNPWMPPRPTTPSTSEEQPLPVLSSAQTNNVSTENASLVTANEPADIKLQETGGTFVVPVSINDALTLNFLLDSGASDVSIPADVVLTLVRTGTLSSADFIGTKNYRLADGSIIPSTTFRIRTLKVGDRKISNVQGSVAGIQGSLLLGQSFLKRFKSWSVDNQRHILKLE